LGYVVADFEEDLEVFDGSGGLPTKSMPGLVAREGTPAMANSTWSECE